jgi:hypothetical protein
MENPLIAEHDASNDQSNRLPRIIAKSPRRIAALQDAIPCVPGQYFDSVYALTAPIDATIAVNAIATRTSRRFTNVDGMDCKGPVLAYALNNQRARCLVCIVPASNGSRKPLLIGLGAENPGNRPFRRRVPQARWQASLVRTERGTAFVTGCSGTCQLDGHSLVRGRCGSQAILIQGARQWLAAPPPWPFSC